ncbi:MAG: transcription antitermination factor NusB [Phycisphaerales bacterium]|nr:transcription antitermination factor NusB [Phycisphaerales bacterium]
MNRPLHTALVAELSGRSIARVLGMQALVAFENYPGELPREIDTFIRDATLHHELGLLGRPNEDALRFARGLALGATEHRAAIDTRLAKASTDWPVHRMPPVDRNILRIGVYELLEEPDTAPAVIIDEAVRIARIFGDVESPNFVNAILDAIRRELGLAAGQSEGKSGAAQDSHQQPTAPESG